MDYEAIVVAERQRDRQPTYRALTPADTLAMHVQEGESLQSALAEPPSGPTVVVTHHARIAAPLANAMRTTGCRAAS